MAGYEMQQPYSSLDTTIKHSNSRTRTKRRALSIHQLGSQNDKIGKAYT
jgi:hypothetical protein